MPRKQEGNFLDSLLAEMTTSIRSTEQMGIVDFAHDIILNGDEDFRLYPTQRAILKAFYREPLSEEEETILNEWLGEDRTTWVKDRKYIALILEAGRRGSKCNADISRIPTTVGDITYEELYNRKIRGEKIGIKTYDMSGDLMRGYITYDIKIEPNAFEDVYEVVSESGRKEITNGNHPFPIWRYQQSHFEWMTVDEIRNYKFVRAPKIGVSDTIQVWGTEKLSDVDLDRYLNVFIKGGKLPDKFNRLSKNSTIKLLEAVFSVKASIAKFRPRNKVFKIRAHKDTHKFLHGILCKLGCNPRIHVGHLVITGLQDILTLTEQVEIGWVEREKLGCMKREFDRGYSEIVPNNIYPARQIRDLNDRHYDVVHGDINWELIRPEEIRYLGKRQTYALEVAGTHVIGSYIISHNSTLASIIALKEFYDLITLESPQKTWGLLPASPIAILVMAQSQAQVKETIFAAIRGYAENSTYFKGLQDAGYIDILAEEIRCPSKNVAIYAKHTNSKSLVGYTLKAMLLDEVARFETTGEEGKNKAFEIWRNVAAGGAAFGQSFKKIAISSAWEPGDPIEVFYQDCHNDPLSLGFKLTTFQVNLALKKGVTPVIVSDYATDFIKARREYEGIRFSKFNTFIDLQNLERNMTGITTIDAQPCKLDITSKAGTRHYAGVDIIRLEPLKDPEQLQFCHIDPALKKDSAALAMAHIERVGDVWKIIVDTLLKWEPHVDENGLKRVVSYIDIERKLDMIHEARTLYRVTFDQWNSESFIQKLHTKGIDSQQVSCSREAQFAYYTLFRDLLAHDYIVLPRDTLWSNDAVTELSELVLKPNRQIIHPYAGKDLGDAIVNVVYQAHQYMVRAGLNIMMGLSPMVAESSNLSRIQAASPNASKLEFGSARDKLYKMRRF